MFQGALDSSSTTLKELSQNMYGIGLFASKLDEMESRQLESDKLVQYLQAKMDLSMKSLAQVSQDQIKLTNMVTNATRGLGSSMKVVREMD
jgi:hypothetical protein